MGNKKRNPSHRHARHPPDSSASVADDVSLVLSSPVSDDGPHRVDAPDAIESAVVKVECERALNSLRRGNHTKALRLMKEAAGRHDGSALLHRVHGTVAAKVAALLDDPSAKLRHLRVAVDSARRAVTLSPSSIEFSHFYASLLFDAATDGRGYEEVVQECERALGIADPVDPAKESLQEESQQKLSTPEARINHVQQELRALIQKSNIASISSWMKNLGNGAAGEERFRLIPMRRISEDPMEVRLVQAARRPNEIKKATKTPEERRKEIEVRVAAARILQQKSSNSPGSLQEEDGRPGSDSSTTSSSAHRLAERRKLISKKVISSTDRMDLARAYWNSMGLEKQLDFIVVNIPELKLHFTSSTKDSLAVDILTEALTFVEARGTWEVWACCRCNEKFTDCNDHIQHTVQEHISSLSTKLQSVMPHEVDGEWIEMLLNGSWKPIDAALAVKMLKEEQLKHPSSVKDADSDTSRKDKEPSPEYWTAKENLDSSSSPEHGEIADQDFPDDFSLKGTYNEINDLIDVSRRWPLSDDAERTKLLERIQAMFQTLVKHKSLSLSHLNKVIQYAIEEIQAFPSGSLLLNHALDQSPVCIFFLDASHLKKILKFLHELSQSCGLGRYSDKDTTPGDADRNGQVTEVTDEISLSFNFCTLSLDGRSFRQKPDIHLENFCVDDAVYKKPDTDVFLSWLFAGPSIAEQLLSWTRMREEKAHQGMEILQMLEKEFYLLQSLCERKCEHLSYEEALQTVENLCFEELKRREQGGKLASQSYETTLRKRQEELAERENDEMFDSCRFELEVISNVLKEAQVLNVSQFGYDEALSSTGSRLCDLDCDEGDDWRMHDYLQQTDTCIGIAIQRQKEQLSVELNKIDARIMRNVTGMQQLEAKLGTASALDYRTVVLPLVKSFLRFHLEDLVDKDAREKSDAARDAFLAELAQDAKKTVNKGNDTKHAHEKSKEKKKSKDNRKSKDQKSLGYIDQYPDHQDTSEQSESVVDADSLEHDFIVSTGDYLKQQEEEFKRRVELEAEERKLEETLEYQRRIEDEAKQKHLAEQSKNAVAYPNNHTDAIFLVNSSVNLNYDSRLQEKTTPTYVEGIEFGDTHVSEDNMHYDHHNMRFKQRNKNDKANHINVGQQHTISDDSEKNNGSCIDEMQAFDVYNGFPVKVGLQVNGIEKSATNTTSSDSNSFQKAKKTNSQSHSKHKQGSAGTAYDGFLPLEQLKAKQVAKHNISKELPEGNGRAFPFSKENHLPARSQRELYEDQDNGAGQNEVRTAGQFQDEDEKRFQEDLKQAVRESLEGSDYVVSAIDMGSISSRKEVLGTGLRNAVGEYNCFLNVIIQSLWHLRRFRDQFLKTSSVHEHVGNPCVVCALYDIFTDLRKASEGGLSDAVAPTSLRIALSNLYPDSKFFQEGQMNDASEVLSVIFDCLHKSFKVHSGDSDGGLQKINSEGLWDCTNSSCIAHTLFGMNIDEQMNCYNCHSQTRHLKYTSFFHNINANSLRTAKVMCPESSFDDLLKTVEMNHRLSCDVEAAGCGKPNYMNHILSHPPHVFTAVLGWQSTTESADDISATLAAITADVDIGVLYCGIDKGSKHSLISMVCYYGQHYHCFAYERDQWVMYDDQTVKVVGGWLDVITMCKRGHLQPQVLFFETVN
ncbi:uncharacterized protein LOC122051406 isoform X1 [Zingiber officinale]|uniref:uncharacterized protein LOC122051406 isoform X1 n=1 Tax=Zingiber officinale TaxID=94328 RepID=UPI001C4B5F57|nr:uncharacterized protein LOC122051406 isoform X1 [Zingiber officinale]